MKRAKIPEHPAAAAAPSLAVLVALAAAATLSPRGLFPRPAEMAGLLAVGALAALYRPGAGAARRYSTPGLAALVLPAALLRLGAVPAALLFGLVSLAASLCRRAAGRRGGAAGDASWRDAGEDAVAAAGAAALAGAVAAPPAAGETVLGWGVVAPAGAYLAGLLLLLLARRVLARDRPRGRSEWGFEALGLAAALAVDAAGWALGTLFFDAAAAGGWPRVAALMAAFALLAAAAAAGERRSREAELRLADLERLQHAHKRILGEISGMGGIAQQILVECRNVLPAEWFQFELAAGEPGGAGRSWTAGPDGVLAPGEPRPDERPRALPGFHRRASWRRIESELRADGEVLATVRLWCDPRRIDPGAEELLASLVPQMASSVDRARLDREAKLDPLTGVPVRRLLESRLQHAYRRALEQGTSMAVVLCDIDHFKKINDTHGHAAGDEALKLFAQTLDAHRREGDLCCRYGGEEFTLLLENTRGNAALGLAERLRQAVAALELEFEGRLVPLTFSAGVAAFPELHIKTASELLLLADEALYQAKGRGRDRCLLNLGHGAYRGPAGPTIRTRKAPAPARAPRLFG